MPSSPRTATTNASMICSNFRAWSICIVVFFVRYPFANKTSRNTSMSVWPSFFGGQIVFYSLLCGTGWCRERSRCFVRTSIYIACARIYCVRARTKRACARVIYMVYATIVSPLSFAVFVRDTCLYGCWGSNLDEKMSRKILSICL